MLALQMLDVAIGMTFVFLLLSLICTALNELIEAKLKLRAIDLERGIRELLQDPKGTAALTEKFYNHPLVYSLFRGSYDPAKIRKNNRYERYSSLPSYIPARTFALALMDIVLPATPTTLSGADDATSSDTSKVRNLQPLREAVGKLQNPKIQQALLTLVDAAGNDIDKARENIETWYNSSMDRVAGWYKRRVQTIIFYLGLGIAIFTNADTIAIFKSLSDNPSLREAIVKAAQQNQAGTFEELETRIDSNMKKLESLGLPIGWNWKSKINNHSEAVPNLRAIPVTFIGWLLKIIGWGITAVAISLGTPFWFDLLNKFMVIRSTVKPREKSHEEGSEDK